MYMQRPKILLVDDSQAEGILLDLAFIEARRSVNLIQVCDGEIAWKQLQAAAKLVPFPFRLIVIDLNLPRFSGLDLLRKLRGWPAVMGVPMVILTTSPSVRERGEVKALNVPLLLKPDHYDGLGAVIAEMIPYLFPAEAGLPLEMASEIGRPRSSNMARILPKVLPTT